MCPDRHPEGTTRILRIIGRMNVGGPALQVVSLTSDLDSKRFTSRLLVGSVARGEADYLTLRAPHLLAHRIPGLGRSPNPLGDPRALMGIIGEIHRFRPHIVHTHTAKAGVLGRLAAQITRVPVTVHTFHGHLLSGYFSPAATKGVVLVERALARRTTRLVAVGERVRDDLLAAGIGSRPQFVVVPPGVTLPTPPERAAARDMLDLPADVPIVAFVARLTAIKRPDRFIDVCERIAPKVSDALFVIAGEGELLQDVRTRAQRLGKRIRFLGWRSDIETVYAAADLLMLTSDNEGMPVSLIEAASVGIPAVTTDVGSASEVVLHGRTGIVTSTAVEDLATAGASLLLDDETRRQMGSAAARHAADKFSARRLIEDTERLYEAIAAEERTR